MCGLVTIYKRSRGGFDPAPLETMTHLLEHRGPDDYGFAFCGPDVQLQWKENRPDIISSGGVAMGHRRLSILDLSADGRQPFHTDDGRYWMVYNGEIYNYMELRAELEQLGHHFRTRTDTEVLLAAYCQWGESCFARFNGMWALVIWDNKNQTLIACRDRFGIKPLYFQQTGEDWVFASEAKALLAFPGCTREPNRSVLIRYLFNRTWPDGGKTFYKDVFEVEAGTYVVLHDGVIKRHRYWELPSKDAPRWSNLDQAATKLGEIFSDSVNLRLRSDVRVGTMLSGGLDSTSVIRGIFDLLSGHGDARRAVGDSLHAFTASFPDDPLDEWDRVQTLGSEMDMTIHRILPLESDQIMELFDDATYALDMPFYKSTPLVHLLLTRCAKAAGVTVVLNGHGADEMFAGYADSYCPLFAASQLRKLKLISGMNEIRSMHSIHGKSWAEAIQTVLSYALPSRLAGLVSPPGVNRNSLFLPGVLESINGQPASSATLDLRDTSILDHQLKEHFFNRILPTWMHMEDRISMAASVESRLPFLDYRLVEFAFSLDDHLKISNGSTKHVLRTAMKGRLPDSIVLASKKFMFSGPDAKWLRGPLRSRLESQLGSGQARVGEYLDQAELGKLVTQFLGGDDERIVDMWRIFSVESWLRRYF